MSDEQGSGMGRSGGGSQKQRIIQTVTTVALVAVAILCSVLGLDDIASDLFALQGGTSYGVVASDQVGNLTFRDAERLESHFQKHGAEMGYGSASDYLAGANAVISNPDALHKTQSEDGDDAYFLESTGEFVVVSQKGYIRTYYLATKDYFNRQ